MHDSPELRWLDSIRTLTHEVLAKWQEKGSRVSQQLAPLVTYEDRSLHLLST